MPSKSDVKILHECWKEIIKPTIEELALGEGEASKIKKSELLKRCIEKYPLSIFKIAFMIEEIYIKGGYIVLSDGYYVPAPKKVKK